MDTMVGGVGFEEQGNCFRRRGDVYRWLRKNHEAVKEWLVKSEPSWDVIASRMASEGVIGSKGALPTGNAARRVWQRVCRDLTVESLREAERAEEERAREIERLTGVPARKHFPRDVPEDWRPSVAEPSRSASHSRDLVPLSSGSSVGVSEKGSGNGAGGEPQTLVLLRQQLHESSYGRRVPISEMGKPRDENR